MTNDGATDTFQPLRDAWNGEDSAVLLIGNIGLAAARQIGARSREGGCMARLLRGIAALGVVALCSLALAVRQHLQMAGDIQAALTGGGP
jgi:hypothetical protein